MKRRVIAGSALIGAWGLLSLLGGCQTPPRQEAFAAEQRLAGKPAARRLEDLTYVTSGFDKSTRLTISSTSEVIEDQGQPRFAAGVSLPVFDGPYSIEVVSLRQGRGGEPQMLYPSVVFLDATFKPVRSVKGTDWKLTTTTLGSGLASIVFINNANLGERYLLITSTRPDEDKLLLHNANATDMVAIPIPFPGGVGMFMLPSGSTEVGRIKASDIGDVVVNLSRYKLRKIGEAD